MSLGERSLLRLRSRLLLAGAGSTAALTGAIVAVALVGAGLVAFDAWPQAESSRATALPLAPARTPEPTGPASGPPADADAATVAADGAAGQGAAGDGPRRADDAVDAPRAGTIRSDAAPGPVVAPASDPAPATEPPPSTDAVPVDAMAELSTVGKEAGETLADVTREVGATVAGSVGGTQGEAVDAVAARAADAMDDAARTIAQALERLPG